MPETNRISFTTKDFSVFKSIYELVVANLTYKVINQVEMFDNSCFLKNLVVAFHYKVCKNLDSKLC